MAAHAPAAAPHSQYPSNMDNLKVEYSVGYQGSPLHIAGDHTALAISGNSICSYSLQGGATKPILWGPRFGISVSAYHFGKKRIAFAEKGLHPSVYVYKTGTLKLKCKISDIAEVEITAIAFSKDGSRLATVSSEPDFRLCLWDIQGEEPSKIAEAHLDWVAKFASFNPVSNDQVCLSGSGRISVWTYEFNFQRTSFPCKAFSVKPHEPHCHAWSEDGKKIYVGCLKGELLVLKPTFTPEVGVEDDEDEDDGKSSFEELIEGDVKTPVADDTTTVIGNDGWYLLKVSKHMDKIAAVSVGHLHIVTSDVNGHVCWLSITKKKEGQKSKSDNLDDAEASSENDSTTVEDESETATVTSNEVKHATLADPINNNNATLEHEESASILFSLDLDTSVVTNISYTEDQSQLLVGSASGCIVLIRINKNALETSLSTRGDPVIDKNLAIVEWQSAYHHGPVLGFASLGDGKFVLTCGQDGSVRVWEAERGKEISRHCFNAAQLCIDSHEKASTAVTGSVNGTICIFKVDSMGRSAIVSQNKLDTSPIDKVSFNKASHHLVAVCKEAGKLYFLNSGSSDLDELELLGYTLVDDAVLSVAWDIRTTKGAGDEYLLLSLARGEIVRIMVPLSRPATEDLFLENKTLNYISFRTQVPLLSIVVGKYYLEKEKVERKVVWGMGQDKKLQQYRLPENAQGWTGTGGTALHAHFNMPGHSKVGSALVLHLETSILITAAEDGALQIRDAVLDPLRQPQKVVDTQLYDGYLGGITCVIVAGNQLFIGGANGVIICAEAPTVGLKTRRPTSAAGKSRISIIPETTTHDSSMDGALSGQLSMLQKYAHTGPRVSLSGMNYIMELRKNVQKLRQEFHDLVEKNDKSPQVEKLVRSELIVDMDLERELRSQGERRVVTVREEVIRENLKKDIMVRRIKEECRKVVAETGKHIWPFVNGSKVANFPLHDKNCSRSRAAHVAKTFRIIELQEHEYTKTLVINNQNELPVPPQSSHSTISEMVTEGDMSTRSKETIVPVKDSAVETSQRASIVDDKSASRRSSGVAPRESAAGKEIDDPISIREEQEEVESPTAELLEKGPLENLLYGSFDLITPKRKRTQRCLLYTQLQLVREAFNKQFVTLENTKDSTVDKIKEMYLRVVELQKKLNLNDDFKLPNLNRQDDFDSVFTVKDEEIKAQNYSSIKKNKGDDANDKKKLKQGFNDAERALQDMMGGKIERKKEEVVVETELEKPAWMLGNPKNFTKEQIKEIKEFDAKLKAIKEEKEKKQRAQEFEMRKLKNDIQDLMTNFDGSLLEFFNHRLQEEAKCLEIEENITRLSMEVEDEEFADERKESDLQKRLDNLKTTKGRSVGIVTEFKRQYEEFKMKYESAINEDKALDRNFKKDFQDCADLVPLLYRHYKKRKNHATKVVQRPADTKSSPKSLSRRGSVPNRSKSPGRFSVNMNKAAAPSDPFTERPEEIDPDIWTRLLSARGRKIHKEDEVRTLSEQMSKMDEYMNRLVSQDDLNRKRIEKALRTLAEFREKREKRRRDLAILLHIKQGLVEIEINPLDGDYVDATLLPKTLIDEFNDVILREAHTKVKILIGMKDFKKGIYEIQWDIRRLQTLEKILIEKIRYIQLLRNTKALQAIIKNGVDMEKVVEDSSLEGRMEHLKGLHQKRIQEKKIHLEQLQNKVKLLQSKNVTSQKNAAALYQQYVFQARLCEKSLGKETNASALKERLKGILAKQKAIDIAKEQVKTISSLEKDCEKWKNKSYPIIPPLPTPGLFNLDYED